MPFGDGGVLINSTHVEAIAREHLAAGKYYGVATILGARIEADGGAIVDFRVTDENGCVPTQIDATFTIGRLNPPATAGLPTKRSSYLMGFEKVDGGGYPQLPGSTALQGRREGNGALVDHGDGKYSYRFSFNILTSVDGGIRPDLPHRVSVMLGRSVGPVADAVFDFVPGGGAVALSRDIVRTEACRECHGQRAAFHGGDRMSVENCVTCHVPGTFDAQSGESLDMTVLMHKLHAGAQLPSVAGPDGIVWNDSDTPVDESADNEEYALWGFQSQKIDYSNIGFPAVIGNCTKCHQGDGADVDNWKSVPSITACESCHDDLDVSTGVNHAAGPQAAGCTPCHSLIEIVAKHDWTARDERNVPEFDVQLTVSTPLNSAYFENEEAPLVTIVLRDKATGALIDHTTVAEDSAPEGLVDGGPPADGLFRAANLMVHGPRSNRNPVLTTAAQARVVSASTGPFDISPASSSTLRVIIDGKWDLTVPVMGGSFSSIEAATGQEVVSWLNGDSTFSAVALAYLDADSVVIQSRNLGSVYSVQLLDSVVANAVFPGDLTRHTISGSSATNNVSSRTNTTANDPRATRYSDRIEYRLAPVTNLVPGTYVVSAEFADRGRVDPSNYRTPSVAVTTFQVKTAEEELPVAGNCEACHWGPGAKGHIDDPSRHSKLLDEMALDRCGACHDAQPNSFVKSSVQRLHAIHYGANLTNPANTVGYGSGDPKGNRNWAINLPQDSRNCLVCHPDGTTSGTWRTKPSAIACWSCHDSPSAEAHIASHITDPTPDAGTSGDEVETCNTCH